ncbi:MAG: Cof-type HAD-IIB family hydrolase [Oscillospiraceae bacterium]|nr:Cof-type HAD-IIB family hydrolase [Oscillospiraceae bacterium]
MVVFFDIDGTIVDNESQIIPDSTVEAIRLLKEKGHVPVVNTGRPFGQVDPRILDLGFDSWVCACGMEVILNGEFVYQDYPSTELCDFIIEQCDKYNMLIQAETAKDLYYNADREYTPAPLREANRLASKGINVVPYQSVEDRSFIKFVTHETEGSDRAGFLAATADYFDPMIHRGTMIEYSKRGNTKANGMRRLLQILNVPKEESFAIGDSENDLTMFDVAGTTICMGDGMEKLKAAADYITDSVLEDGIFNALRHFGLI